MNKIPIIDIQGLISNDLKSAKNTAREINRACLDNGFFYISNHGVDQDLIDDLMRVAKDFFSLPQVEKEKISIKNSFASRGYEGLFTQALEKGTTGDLKESIYFGRELAFDHPDVVARKYGKGPNQWPGGIKSFKETVSQYFKTMESLSSTVMKGLALSLDLEKNHFANYCFDPLARLRLLHYPPQSLDAPKDQRSAGAHTDFGGLTILLQDDIGGLQVFDQKQQSWIEATPKRGTFIVNLGDLIARWTNDKYKSTLHRVINKSGKERYSVPFFFHGNTDYVVKCLTTCQSKKNPPKYKAVTVLEHFEERYKASRKSSA